MSGAPFTLRDAVPGDLPEVLRLVRALAEYERLLHRAVATEEDFRDLLFGPAPLLHAVLAEVGRRVVGGALWYNNVSTFTGRPGIHLEDIFVEPAHRGLGIGRAFFQHLARLAVARGWARLDWQVLDWNAPAIHFYEGLGAEALDDWRGRRVSGDALARLAE
ncbi:GNAT family N-acetyltransferase [Roseomonas nepalensis]|uniref:GNAT family N-acetyltransferase n=1 Tax=Muricoccus nepalensis TaxID=1854500 RepID=A0A502GIU0_9PROT|nr:GNAT family N-acetyltransferase [Roseomonas nepalensis]TPG61210.1 GNAT family N-acetyltransferase [Roseomonas nepalensis]